MIYYNSLVAKTCGSIIKAVLVNYIYNYHKGNTRKGIGHPVCLSVREFVYRYTAGETALWKKSYVHKTLKELELDGHLTVTKENDRPVYKVSDAIVELLNAEGGQWISFDLDQACTDGLYYAIVSRYILYMIDESPKKCAFNLNINEMAKVNCISPAQIYRVINKMKEREIVKPDKSKLKYSTRALCLVRKAENA